MMTAFESRHHLKKRGSELTGSNQFGRVSGSESTLHSLGNKERRHANALTVTSRMRCWLPGSCAHGWLPESAKVPRAKTNLIQSPASPNVGGPTGWQV